MICWAMWWGLLEFLTHKENCQERYFLLKFMKSGHHCVRPMKLLLLRYCNLGKVSRPVHPGICLAVLESLHHVILPYTSAANPSVTVTLVSNYFLRRLNDISKDMDPYTFLALKINFKKCNKLVTARSPIQTLLWSPDVACCALRQGTLSIISQSTLGN